MTAGLPDDGGLFGSRRDGPAPKLVVVGIVWAAVGVVALITALLMSSTVIAVFGVLCVLAGGGIYAGQRTRERIEHDEALLRSDPGALDPDDADDHAAPDHGGSRDDGQHATRVMSTSDRDDIVDAEYTEIPEYEPSPSEQDDGTGYDDEEIAYRRRREHEWAREARDREDEDDTPPTGIDEQDADEQDADSTETSTETGADDRPRDSDDEDRQPAGDDRAERSAPR